MVYKGERWPEYQPAPLSLREKTLLLLGLSVATGAIAYRLYSDNIITKSTRAKITIITSDAGL